MTFLFNLGQNFVNVRIILCGLAMPTALCILPGVARGAQIFAVNFGAGTVSEYTTSGVPLNPTFITGLSFPEGIAISGDKLFVANAGRISQYTTSGALVERALVSGLNGPGAIAVSGKFLYVVSTSRNSESSIIGKYTISGETVNASLISDLGPVPDIVVSGGKLFISDGYSTISEYTTSGAEVNPR
jgi:hypothetical protein